jgi:uroporphyrinogen-III decarboxylase
VRAGGPSKDCAYEGPFLKAITGYPIAMEGAEAACAHSSPVGNIAKAAARGRTCLLGNIDTNLLALGTAAEVDAACRGLIEICKPGGGFILGPGCAMAPATPADNIHALIESAKKYGAYSARLSGGSILSCTGG